MRRTQYREARVLRRGPPVFRQGSAALRRLQFLNRGQAWVERRIAEALPRITDARVRRALEAMRISHVANIAACEALVTAAPASGATSNEA